MRWDDLFADMESQLASQRLREVEREARELTRAEHSEAMLEDRCAASAGAAVRLGLRGGDQLRGRIAAAGAGWVVLTERAQDVLVPLAGVLWIEGLDAGRASPEARRRLGLGGALRALARSREPVRLRLLDGPAGADLQGTVDRVGRDHLELAVHPEDEVRRRRAVRGMRAVPFAAVGCVVSREADPDELSR